jgi:outer membrane protein assembly factor BamB
MNTQKDMLSKGLTLQKSTRLADRYLIQDTIRSSSLSAIYRARDLHFPNITKLVAVKELINPATDAQFQEKFVENFERQANLLATLTHPSIPRVLDYFTQGKNSYLVFEFVHGKTLEYILGHSEGFLSEDIVTQWAIGLCEVLQYLHSHLPEPIIYQELNPANVMLNQHGQLILINFSLPTYDPNEAGGEMELPGGYLPPERYNGEVSARSDIYSIGATMYYLLSGENPQLKSQVPLEEQPIRLINPEISPDLETIVYKATNFSAADRYQSAEEMKSALLAFIGRSDSRQLTPQYDAVSPIAENEIQPIWTFECGDEIRGNAACDRGIVYIGSYDKHLYALNIESGKMLWKYFADGGIVSKPAIVEDSVFIGSEDHRLHVVSARNGSLQWTYYTDGPVRSSPFAAHGHLFIGSDDAAVHAINIRGGRGIWKTETDGEIRSSPFVTEDSVYFGNEAGEFFCLDFRGGIKWRFKAKRAITSSPIVTENLVLFSSIDTRIYALDANSGVRVWSFEMDKGSISSIFVADGLAFTGAIDGNIYCVSLSSAKEVWRFSTGHQVTGSPIIHNDRLYCGSVDGYLYCLDHQTGQLHWKFKTGNPITATPTVFGDIILIGSTDNRLYALPVKAFQ